MTIAEELDKRSGRPHKSTTIADAMKYAFGIEKTPDTIGAAVKDANFNPPDEFTVTWKNGEETLETDEGVEYGTTPTYDGETPTGTGTFLGWNSDSSAATALAEIPAATADATYFAIFQA